MSVTFGNSTHFCKTQKLVLKTSYHSDQAWDSCSCIMAPLMEFSCCTWYLQCWPEPLPNSCRHVKQLTESTLCSAVSVWLLKDHLSNKSVLQGSAVHGDDAWVSPVDKRCEMAQRPEHFRFIWDFEASEFSICCVKINPVILTYDTAPSTIMPKLQKWKISIWKRQLRIWNCKKETEKMQI